MRSALYTVVVYAFVAALSSCTLFGVDTPIKTIAWQPDGKGYLQYCTNDQSKSGFGEYFVVSSSYQNSPTTSSGGAIVVSFNKISGASNNGFGVVFSYQDSNNYYLFELTLDNYYRIYKKVAGTYTAIGDWEPTFYNASQYIKNKSVHTIEIDRGISNDYQIKIDNYSVSQFADSSIPNSGYSGYYVSIGNSLDENFPFTPEDVRFQMAAPIQSP
jgi:hypothetical protein